MFCRLFSDVPSHKSGTEHLEYIELSEAYYEEIKNNPYYKDKLEIVSEPKEWDFDDNGDLPLANGSLVF